MGRREVEGKSPKKWKKGKVENNKLYWCIIFFSLFTSYFILSLFRQFSCFSISLFYSSVKREKKGGIINFTLHCLLYLLLICIISLFRISFMHSVYSSLSHFSPPLLCLIKKWKGRENYNPPDASFSSFFISFAFFISSPIQAFSLFSCFPFHSSIPLFASIFAGGNYVRYWCILVDFSFTYHFLSSFIPSLFHAFWLIFSF